MAGQKSNSKKPRKTKVSKGIHGGGGKLRPRMDEVSKALMGQGVMARLDRPPKRRAPRTFEPQDG